MFSRIPIWIRFTLISGVTLLFATGFMFLKFPQDQEKQIVKSMRDKSERLSETIATAISISMSTNDFELLTETLTLAKKDRDLLYVTVLGKISDKADKTPTTSKDKGRKIIAEYNPNNLEIDYKTILGNKSNLVEEQDIMHRVVPIKIDNKFSFLLLGLSLEKMNNEIRDQKLTTLFFSGIILIIGVILSLYLSNLIARPIVQLRDAAIEVTKGNLDVGIYVSTNDEIGDLAKAFNTMTKNIKDSVDTIMRAKKETDDILGNVKEGLFLLNPKYEMESQYSNALEEIFMQKKLGNRNFLMYLKNKVTEKKYNSTSDFLDLMYKSDVKEKFVNRLNPLEEIEFYFVDGTGGYMSKFLKFNFRRIIEENKIAHLMVTVNDVTAQVLLTKQLKEAEEKTRHQIELLLSILHVKPTMLKDFIDESQNELESINIELEKRYKGADSFHVKLEKIFRSMHTIKGNASLIDLKFFSEKAHDFEEKVVDLKEKSNLGGNDFLPLVMRLKEMYEDINEMKDLVSRLTNLQSSFRGRRSDEWDNLISSVNNLIHNLSEELGKSVKLAADDFNPLVIPYRYHRIVKDVIVQLIRNSIVHGIEDPDERKAAKKDPKGIIKIGSRINNGYFELKYKDDGRGLQIEKMRKKAISMGKWDESTINSWKDSQIASLIFQPGFSTAEKVDMGAGRGVGMDIIHQRVSEFGGKIKVLFVPGKYCEFKILLPEEQT